MSEIIMMMFMMSMTMNMLFLSSKTPMSMLLIILMQTILTCMFSGNIKLLNIMYSFFDLLSSVNSNFYLHYKNFLKWDI